jgi:NADH:ubiquinone oxidoreductase subunit H
MGSLCWVGLVILKYVFKGALRYATQMVSYEVSGAVQNVNPFKNL